MSRSKFGVEDWPRLWEDQNLPKRKFDNRVCGGQAWGWWAKRNVYILFFAPLYSRLLTNCFNVLMYYIYSTIKFMKIEPGGLKRTMCKIIIVNIYWVFTNVMWQSLSQMLFIHFSIRKNSVRWVIDVLWPLNVSSHVMSTVMLWDQHYCYFPYHRYTSVIKSIILISSKTGYTIGLSDHSLYTLNHYTEESKST